MVSFIYKFSVLRDIMMEYNFELLPNGKFKITNNKYGYVVTDKIFTNIVSFANLWDKIPKPSIVKNPDFPWNDATEVVYQYIMAGVELQISDLSNGINLEELNKIVVENSNIPFAQDVMLYLFNPQNPKVVQDIVITFLTNAIQAKKSLDNTQN